MTGGCALLAYPDRYAVTGVMTFIVGQAGVICENDLGPDTETEVAELTEYNPDDSWTVVKVP